MDDQPFKFHEAYAALTAGLPPSQIRLTQTRLTKCKLNPLTAEEIAGEHPRVRACLEKISQAYSRKKLRSATSSKVRRDATRSVRHVVSGQTTDSTNPGDSTVLENDGVAVCVASEIATLVDPLEAVTIECEEEPEPVQEEPEPDQEPIPPQPLPLRQLRSNQTTEAPAMPCSTDTLYQKPLRRSLVRPVEPKKVISQVTVATTNNSLVRAGDSMIDCSEQHSY